MALIPSCFFTCALFFAEGPPSPPGGCGGLPSLTENKSKTLVTRWGEDRKLKVYFMSNPAVDVLRKPASVEVSKKTSCKTPSTLAAWLTLARIRRVSYQNRKFSIRENGKQASSSRFCGHVLPSPAPVSPPKKTQKTTFWTFLFPNLL